MLTGVRRFMVDWTSEAESDRYLPTALIKAIEQNFTIKLQPMAEMAVPSTKEANNGANNKKADNQADNVEKVQEVTPEPSKAKAYENDPATQQSAQPNDSASAKDNQADETSSDSESTPELQAVTDRLNQL